MTGPAQWVPVASCANLSEAEATAAVLEAEGIETRVEDRERVGDTRLATWMSAYPQVVMVGADAEVRAREVLAATSTASEAELEAEALAATAPPDERPRLDAPRMLLLALVAALTLFTLYQALAPVIDL